MWYKYRTFFLVGSAFVLTVLLIGGLGLRQHQSHRNRLHGLIETNIVLENHRTMLFAILSMIERNPEQWRAVEEDRTNWRVSLQPFINRGLQGAVNAPDWCSAGIDSPNSSDFLIRLTPHEQHALKNRMGPDIGEVTEIAILHTWQRSETWNFGTTNISSVRPRELDTFLDSRSVISDLSGHQWSGNGDGRGVHFVGQAKMPVAKLSAK